MRSRRLPSELLLALLVAIVGAVDAFIGDAFDLFVLFVVVASLCLVGVVRTTAQRDRVHVRADLARWLAVTAAEQGERPSDLADRAIGSFRAALIHDPGDTGPFGHTR